MERAPLINMHTENNNDSSYTIMMEPIDMDRVCNRGFNTSSQEAYEEIPELNRTMTPFNATCLAEFLEVLTSQLKKYSDWEAIIFTCIYAVISILAIIGNGLVILAVVRKKAMRTNRNVFIVNLAISNLMLAVVNIPLLWLPSVTFEFPYSRFLCKFGNVLPGSNIYCSTLTISVMAIDRYNSVRKLSLGSTRGRLIRAIVISLLIWVFSFILSLPLLIYYDTVMLYVFKDVFVHNEGIAEPSKHSFGWCLCKLNTASDQNAGDGTEKFITLFITTLQALFIYLVPLVVLSLFNVKLTRFLKMNANQMSKHGTHTKSSTATNHSAASRGLSLPSALARNANERAQKKMSVAKNNGVGRSGAAEHASEKRTSRTTSLLIAMASSFAALWLPFTIVTFMIDLDLFGEQTMMIIERLDQMCKMVSMLSICVNPFLYGFLNTNFRHEFSEIIYSVCLRRCTPDSQRQMRAQRPFHPEYSSVGLTLRQSSVQRENHDDRSNLFSVIRRSFRGSVEKMRTINSDSNGFSSFRSKSCSARSSTNNRSGRAASANPAADQASLNVDRPEIDGDAISEL